MTESHFKKKIILIHKNDQDHQETNHLPISNTLASEESLRRKVVLRIKDNIDLPSIINSFAANRPKLTPNSTPADIHKRFLEILADMPKIKGYEDIDIESNLECIYKYIDFVKVYEQLPKNKSGNIDNRLIVKKEGSKLLKIVRADIYIQICKDDNPGINLNILTYGSDQLIKFFCYKSKCAHHKWITRLCNRSYRENGCTYCAGKQVCICDSLTTLRPDIGSEWDYGSPLNEGVTPDQVSVHSGIVRGWICSVCFHTWSSIVSNRTNRDHSARCQSCWRKELRYTQTEAEEKYRENDFELLETYVNSLYPHKVLCKICQKITNKRLNDALNYGCNECFKSRSESIGASNCRQILTDLGIDFIDEKRLDVIPSRRYDFFFTYKDKTYIVEYDGKQHFRYDPYFHDDIDDFLQRQEIDRLKTYVALKLGYNMIRIENNNIDHIRTFITTCLEISQDTSFLEVDNVELYKYITEIPVSNETLIKYCPELLD